MKEKWLGFAFVLIAIVATAYGDLFVSNGYSPPSPPQTLEQPHVQAEPHTHAGKQDKKYFYIYDWPEELANVYPPPGAVLDNSNTYSHDFYPNNGAGKLIDKSIGYFATWQFSLFKNVYSRLLVSEYRTMDPAKASSFIIPFDPGTHSYVDHNTGRPRLASPHGWEAIRQLQKAQKDPTFWAKNGHNHFVLFSVTGYQMVGIGVKVFFMTICQNCTVMSIETAPGHIAIAGRSKKYWYSVPYPSSIHWHEGLVDAPWQARLPTHPTRPVLAMFIGSLKTKTAQSNALRRKLHNGCLNHEKCQWLSTAHACTGVLGNVTSVLLYRRTIFCMTPPGDSLTRKSVFDSYTLGCIPVIFARATLTQYNWHLSAEEIEESTVYISKLDIIDEKVDFMKILEKIPQSVIEKKQDAVARLAPRLQYSVVPKAIMPANWRAEPDGKGTALPTTWRPPVRDATDVIIDRILDSETIEPINGFSAERLLEMQREQRAIMGRDPDYMGMSPPDPDGGGGGGKAKPKKRKNQVPGIVTPA